MTAPAKSKPNNPNSPWRRGPNCDTPNAGKSFKRYAARAIRHEGAQRRAAKRGEA
ncbi:MAG: hypothetical protein ACREPV_01345 [Lysobacter sp.]